MNCFLCGKKIGLFRSLSDQQYCCSQHRTEARMASAQALRDEEDDESWAVAKSRKRVGGVAAKSAPGSNAGAILAFVAVGGVMLAVLMLSGPAKGGAAYPSVSFTTGKDPNMFDRASGTIGSWVHAVAPVTLKQDFANGLWNSLGNEIRDWSSQRLSASTIDDPRDWIGKTRTSASIRLWKKSTAMQNYQFEFQGALEKTSLSWVVRASDAKNFYATKLQIFGPGPLPNARLIRYTMVDGREEDRSMLNLPVVLERGKNYNVRVTAQDDQFLTYLDGRWIGKVTDNKLIRGGVGFIDDQADPQKIAWVTVSERDTFLGRLFSHFALFVMPGDGLPQ
jgi:hypothetical protein